jgi:hypothetical protein
MWLESDRFSRARLQEISSQIIALLYNLYYMQMTISDVKIKEAT